MTSEATCRLFGAVLNLEVALAEYAEHIGYSRPDTDIKVVWRDDDTGKQMPSLSITWRRAE